MSTNLIAGALFHVNGIVAVVTGGGSGIGLMITRALVANGAHRVFIVGRREDVLRKAAEDINPEIVTPISGDITSQESLIQVVERVKVEIGYVNLLIANAGIMGPRPLKNAPDAPPPSIAEYRAHALKTPMEDFTRTYAVNTTGVYYTTLAFLELLDAGNKTANMGPDWRSQVIATSSIGGFSRLNGASFAYNSSKAAVAHMMKMMATTFVPFKIRCNVLAPGIFPSDLAGGIMSSLDPGKSGIQFLAEPFHRMFFLDNLAIGYPHAEIERVSVAWLFIYAGAVPLGTLVAWALVVRPGTHKAHVTILGWFISMILTLFITDVIKNAVGRPRPDLIARCKPAPGTPAHQLVTFEVCTEPNHHVLHDGWRSFPSGHSSFSFSGLGYLALFIAGQCHVYRPRADLARVLLALAPLLGAALIAISRCEDYRHDVYDVSVGSVLGMAVAHYTYRRYYPALRNKGCATPYPNPADETKGFGKVKDEEEALRGVQEFELDDLSEEEEGSRDSRPLNGRR
ncbi:NAD(P)-binding protein [Cucurbitaria berberidis CBS 394.84]|uniref:NAD(P)-binding protein n=1 Tax=Cucurbitaria berberidis CBS 394.84 TaxID=1168544 RepID=A0A9P4GTT9_9PLEO|nr:NAD(P)-binding protein [Cucurbitaria berberidis CBS 394.84]KAF1851169.1 NAD(P)-binding protein [Cucurbitaria berberidis CBS 394.84]